MRAQPDSLTPEMLEAAAIEWTKQCHGYPYDGSIRSWEKFFGALFAAAMKAAPLSTDANASPTENFLQASLNPSPSSKGGA